MTSKSEIHPLAAMHVPAFADGQRYLLAATKFQAQAFKAAMRYQIELLAFLKHRCE
jgi:hypothetical protein